MGRRKIEIQPLGDERTRTVTFVKRKAGLFKKAYELSVLCEVDMAVIIVGSDRIYEYSSVDTKELLNYYKHKSPYESKSPEDYGEYKKRATLKSKALSALAGDDLADMHADSDFESASPEPKRQKIGTVPASIYTQQQPVNSQFLQSSNTRKQPQKLSTDMQSQRPVLRVQIPSDTKSQAGSTDTVTPTERTLSKKETLPGSADGSLLHPPPLSSARYSFNTKFRSPDLKKHASQSQMPLSKSQSSSPSGGSMPQLPLNGSNGFFSSLPPPSPSGQYPPSILPTPVFNQVFNQQYMNQMTGMPNLGSNTPGVGPMNPANNMPQMSSSSPTGDPGGQVNANAEDPIKFKPPLQHHYMNGEQTPVSGLPSRYMNEIFPSPSNLYPSQEWPTGLTPYSSTMSHYFAGLPPSANGATPHSMNNAFVNSHRTSVPASAQRPMTMRAASVSNVPTQVTSQDDQQNQSSGNTVTQPSSSELMGQYYKKED